MTYENVVSWCENNIPKEDFENFYGWYNECYEQVNTPALFDNPEVFNMLEQSWLNSYGSLEPYEPTTQIPKRQATLDNTPTENKKPEAIVILPKTGSAPIIPKPTLVFPANIPKERKENILTRFKNFVLRRK